MSTELELEAASLEEAIRNEKEAASACWRAHDTEGDDAHTFAAVRMQQRLDAINAQLERETAVVH